MIFKILGAGVMLAARLCLAAGDVVPVEMAPLHGIGKGGKSTQRPYILVMATFTTEKTSSIGWVALDTGTPHPLPMVLASEAFAKRLSQGKMGDVTMAIGPASWKGVGLLPFPVLAIEDINRDYRKELGATPAVGVVSNYFLSQYLLTVDYPNHQVYFRPLDAVRRTFYETKPLADVPYRNEGGAIRIPITLNHKIQGEAYVDTGTPFSWVDPAKITKPLTSWLIGDYEATPHVRRPPWKVPIQPGTIAHLGNDVLGSAVLTIDPREKRLYLESPREP